MTLVGTTGCAEKSSSVPSDVALRCASSISPQNVVHPPQSSMQLHTMEPQRRVLPPFAADRHRSLGEAPAGSLLDFFSSLGLCQNRRALRRSSRTRNPGLHPSTADPQAVDPRSAAARSGLGRRALGGESFLQRSAGGSGASAAWSTGPECRSRAAPPDLPPPALARSSPLLLRHNKPAPSITAAA
jgi:hypothetical protein